MAGKPEGNGRKMTEGIGRKGKLSEKEKEELDAKFHGILLFTFTEAKKKEKDAPYNFTLYIYDAAHDLEYKFINMICNLRSEACGGHRLGREKGFMTITLFYGTDSKKKIKLTLLIHKPSLYLVGFRAGEGNWKVVKDFVTACSHEFISGAEPLDYESGYSTGMPTEFSYNVLVTCIKKLQIEPVTKLQKNEAQCCFLTLAVMISESFRFHLILRIMSKSLGFNRAHLTLTDEHMEMIHSWDILSYLSALYKMGLGWNPLGEYPGSNLVVDHGFELALAMDLENVVLNSLQQLYDRP